MLVATPKKSLVAACALILLAGAFSYFLRYLRVQPDCGPDFSKIPYELGRWQGEEQRFQDYAYDVLSADTTTYRVYRDSEGRRISLFIAYFKSQKYGGQIHSPRHCLPGSGWSIVSREQQILDGGAGMPQVAANLMKIVREDYAEYMWYWFETRNGVNSSEYGLKLDLVFNSLFLRPTDAAFIRFGLTTSEAPAVAERIGAEFAAELLQYLDDALPFNPVREG